MQQLLKNIIKCQQPGGGFESVMSRGNKVFTDANACITALVLRELLKRPGLVPQIVIDKAFNFLSSCISNRGSYNFYPVQINVQNKLGLPDDADDTALITLILLKTGRLNRRSLIKDTCVLLDRHRLTQVSGFDPPWFISGAFYTWLGVGGQNIVDCCVNANIVALYANAGLQHLRGYAEACNMISRAVLWAGRCNKRLRSIMPFYASDQELFYAVEYAVEMGAVKLTDTLQLLDWINPRDTVFDPGKAVCCSAYGGVTWHCPLLLQLRHLA